MTAMTFQISTTDPTPAGRLELRVIDHKRFQLMHGFAYKAPHGEIFEVPRT
jgi:hypothetical protein